MTVGFEFWIDRGGTFTDVIARSARGELRTLKLLSINPGHYDDAAVEAVGRVLAAAPPEERRVRAIKMGTTVATNALLERRGEPTVLVITAGLEDAVRIGGQQRPDLFALDIRLPEMLYARVVGARERIAADGRVLAPLDEAELRRDLASARAEGLSSVAIVLLHGYRFPAHEAAAQRIARETGFKQISVSHQVMPLQKLVARADTTLVDAYLSPVLDRYVASVHTGLKAELHGAPLLFMQSHGGLAAAEHFHGKDSLLSGPAGGVVGMVHAARTAGCPDVIGFDMGGTSTDVALFAGELERTRDVVIAGVRVTAPMLRIHTVAAGGGSLLKFTQGRLAVGPDSAGAFPGPACYRHGGPLTVTDANVLLGRIQPDFFPRVFGASAAEPIDAAATAAAFDSLADEVAASTDKRLEPATLAAGFLRIAIEHMANAIKKVSVQRGHDITSFALCCFGGAGGQHALKVADALGIRKVLIHPLAGVLSAYGIGVADLRIVKQGSIERRLETPALASLAPELEALAAEARAALLAQGADIGAVRIERRLHMKLTGSDTTLPVPLAEDATSSSLRAAFDELHAAHFGFRADADAPLTIEAVELEAVAPSGGAQHGVTALAAAGGQPLPVARRRVWFDGWHDAPVYDRAALGAGALVTGPAVIVETNATTVVERGWQARVADDSTLLLEREAPPTAQEHVAEAADPILLEVFNNLFMHVAEEMGIVLENTAHSVNIKERLDFSCALFAPSGALIANAPHMPVHLGSMSESVKSVLRNHDVAPGDAYLLNTPYNGGTHLPDMTVVSPVFDSAGRELRFIVASRAHHADVGGITPGSMPPSSSSIDEEGVLFDGFRVVSDGRLDEATLRAALAHGPYPARNPDQNVADLKAQLAANARGAMEIGRLVQRFGADTVARYMRHVQDNAADCVRSAIERLNDGRFTVELDGGERIVVRVHVDRATRSAVVDFAGTSAVSHSNFNAPSAIVTAAVLYVFRTLVAENIPLNEGCLTPLTIRIPENSLLAPTYPAAVVAGNVETSQCVTDALLGALDACASAQGTMNNFTFGNERYQYYETLCGGAGAGPTFDGASAVHTHMTNSRLTDPEVLEQRYPVRILRFGIRTGSGGRGRHRGGDGVIREIEFLEPMDASILSNRRRVPPFGLHGGKPGACGRNYVMRADGQREDLPGTASVTLAPGDRFVIETPGGGGYGRPP